LSSSVHPLHVLWVVGFPQSFLQRSATTVILHNDKLHISTDWAEHFFLRIVFPLTSTKLLPSLTIWVTRRVFYKKHELITLHENLGSHPVHM
jgi:hypothetical protein